MHYGRLNGVAFRPRVTRDGVRTEVQQPQRHVGIMSDQQSSLVSEPGPTSGTPHVLTVRTEVTDRMLIFGERHLRRVLAVYAAHYNARRPHRALRLRPPRPTSPVPEPVHGRIRRRPILGGLICECRCGAPGWRTTRLGAGDPM